MTTATKDGLAGRIRQKVDAEKKQKVKLFRITVRVPQPVLDRLKELAKPKELDVEYSRLASIMVEAGVEELKSA